jgi:hypothetical protein
MVGCSCYGFPVVAYCLCMTKLLCCISIVFFAFQPLIPLCSVEACMLDLLRLSRFFETEQGQVLSVSYNFYLLPHGTNIRTNRIGGYIKRALRGQY